jgi:hypothetical protein
MAFVKIDISDGSIIDQSNPAPEKRAPSDEADQFPYEMPELQITEIEHTPEKGADISPWMIQEIIREIENSREKIKDNGLLN